MTTRFTLLAAAVLVSAATLRAAPDAPDANEPQNDSKDTPRVTKVKPLVKWTFDVEEPGTWKGKKVIEPQGLQTWFVTQLTGFDPIRGDPAFMRFVAELAPPRRP